MKKVDKINLLRNSIDTHNLCRCFFKYDPNYWYFYILNFSDKLLLGIEEDDFLLDGFQIRKISDLKKIEIKDDLCNKINEELNLLADVNKPKIDISSWKTVFESLKALDVLIIVENEKTDSNDDFLYLGYVTEIKQSFIIFSSVDADGAWYDNIKISYSEITSVTFNDRYSRAWQDYIVKHKLRTLK